jgi:hypothetical protein
VPIKNIVTVLNGDMIGRNHIDSAAFLGMQSPHKNSTEKVRFAANGNVGIGNSTPAHTLRVQGDISLSGGVHANGSLGSAGEVLHSNGTVAYWAVDDNAGGTVTSVASGNGITGGTITSTGTLSAVAGTGTVVNATGIHVNASYIATISANAATYLNSATNFGNAAGITAPAFYDSANTTFVVDPATTTRLKTVNIDALGWNSIVSQFGQRNILLNELSDLLYQADKRFTITNGSSVLFDGDFGTNLAIPISTTRVININVAGQSGVPAGGITYPEGYFIVSFYYTTNLYSSITLRTRHNGTWITAAAPTDISTNSGFKVLQFSVPGNNYLTDFELTVATDATNEAWLASLNYVGLRLTTTELELPFVSKHFNSNYLFGSFGVKNNSGVINNLLSGTSNSYLAATVGNLGVGTTTPARKLDVYGSGQFSDASGIQTTIWSQATSGTGGVGTNNDYPFTILANGSEHVRITSTGNVGIGTTTPSEKFAVNGRGFFNSGVRLGTGYSALDVATGASGLYLSGSQSALNHVFISPSGNVGIGNTTPAHTLSVNGPTNLAGAVTGITTLAAGNTTITGFANVSVSVNSALYTIGTTVVANTTGTYATHLGGVAGASYVQNTDSRTLSGNLVFSGSNTTVNAEFRVVNSTANVFFAAANGNIGIGTTTPLGRLDVKGRGNSYLDGLNIVDASTTAKTSFAHTSGSLFVGTANSTSGADASTDFEQRIRIYEPTTVATNAILQLGDPDITILHNGNIGVGTTTPGVKLDVNGDARIANGSYLYWYNYNSTTNGPRIVGGSDSLTLESGPVGAGRGALTLIGHNNTTLRTDAGSLSLSASQLSAAEAYIDFSTAGSERMRITNTGFVGIGTTSPSYPLTVAGQPSFNGVPFSEAIDYDESAYFSLQKHLESNNINCFGSSGTNPTFENTNNTTTPFNKIASFSAYYNGISDFIPVQPGERLYGEIYALRETGSTGTAGQLYVGIARYDKDKNVIATNIGLDYFVASSVNVPQNSTWNKYSGYTTLPTSHTVFSGSDGGPVRYVRAYILVNYNTGTIPTKIGGFTIRKVSAVKDVGDFAVLGNLGVGTTSPTSFGAGYTTVTTLGSSGAVFEAKGASGSNLRLQADNAYGMVDMNSNHPLLFRTNAAERMRIASDGNVGVGTGSPAARLDVSTASGFASTPSARFWNNNGGGSVQNLVGLQIYGNLSNGLVDSTIVYGNTVNGYLAFGYHNGTSYAERMRIANTGNVGIGTASPQAALDLGAATNGRAITWGSDGAGRYASIFTPYSASGLVLAGGFHGNTTASDSYVSSHTGTYYNNGIRINTFGANGIQFFTDASAAKTAGAAFVPTERMRITSAGDVGIGITSPSYKLDVSSSLRVTSVDATAAYNAGVLITTTASATASTRNATIVIDPNGADGIGVDYSYLRMYGSGEFEINNSLSTGFMTFKTNTTERMRIANTGNIGIGVTAPYAKLNILKASTYNGEDAAAIAISSSETSGTASMVLGSDNASAISYIQGVNRGTSWTHNIALNPNGGNVGIGTISPSAKLSVSDSAAPKMNFLVGTVERAFISYTESTSITRIDSDAILTLCTNNTESARIDASGNVGIGTASPAYKLHVNGAGSQDIYISSSDNNNTGLRFAGAGTRGRIYADSSYNMYIQPNAQYSNPYVIMKAENDSVNQIRVGINTTTPAYTLQVNGSFAATTKSFVIDHPTKPNHKLRYGSLESPYHGVRLTGEAEVIDGTCTVKLPDYIHALCKQEGVNVQLTNIKHGKVLWVDQVDIDNNEFTVATESSGNHKFYWSFTAIRKDIEDMVVEFENNEEEQ